MSAHTPGPWSVGSHRSINSTSGTICETWSHMGTDEADANERLISAAPELLEALQSAHMALIGYTHQNEITHNALEKARAAICKATGEQQ